MAITFSKNEEKFFLSLLKFGPDHALEYIYKGGISHVGLRKKDRLELAKAVITNEYTVVETALDRIEAEIEELNSKLDNPITGYSKEIKAQIRALERAKQYILHDKALEVK